MPQYDFEISREVSGFRVFGGDMACDVPFSFDVKNQVAVIEVSPEKATEKLFETYKPYNVTVLSGPTPHI